MKLVTINEKGGVGKSTVAAHFLTAYLLDRRKESGGANKVKVYEFDEHNDTAQEMKNESNIEMLSIRLDDKSLEAGLIAVEFDELAGEDIIVDVGGSQNTDLFLAAIKKSPELAEDMIFVVPVTHKNPLGAENTIGKIQEAIEDPRVIVALNGVIDPGDVESEFPFFYGKEDIEVPASKLSSDSNLTIVNIGQANTPLALADFNSCSLWTFATLYRKEGLLKPKDRLALWEKLENVSYTKEMYIEKMRTVNASGKAFNALQGAQTLYDAIVTLRKQ